jgi:hypothetical protein
MKNRRKMIARILALFCALSFITFAAQVYAQEHPVLDLTRGSFSEEDNFSRMIRKDMGNDFIVADWNDLKELGNINRWMRDMRLKDGQKFMLTRDGQYESGRGFHYFVQFFENGRPPVDFRVFDKIGGKLFLGSWHGLNVPILVKRDMGGNHDKDHFEKGNPDKEPRKDFDNKGDFGRNDAERIKITLKTVSEKNDLNRIVRKEFGGDYTVADWNDLKSIRNIDEWIRAMKLKNNWKIILTKDGKPTSGGNRYYFAQFCQNGKPPAGFLVHDKIGGKLFLGSWYGLDAHILVKRDR